MRKNIILACCTVVVAAIAVSGCAYKTAQPRTMRGDQPVRFAVIGDRTGGHEPGIYGQIVNEVERMKPDFVLTVGDMIEGYTDDTVAVKQEWDEYRGLLQPLTVPVYFTSGNYDIWDSTSLGLYQRIIGNAYYSVDLEGIHFVFLDNSRYYTVDAFPGEQIEWLVADLERNMGARYTFVFFHIPYWIETIAEDEADTLHSLFVKYGVDAVFTGHYHSYFSGEFDGIIYTGVGSSGGACSPGPTGLQYHFVWVTVDSDGIWITLRRCRWLRISPFLRER
ncbi:hypothetical protein AMJ40_04300 [candidate division TA06 bacterium DG_26]|uniref:Calcineurin-like phosphoesterase domain-containing protein n=1 Tax=candidate division TA06 bacterium DG_26 TaxID=1703771 RepID=A0A0S7WIG5_UNCT6|nr:MAG: hypothetical protein AMJ40_04300 [candidate division TA06 bacterium DG_26]